MNNDQTPSFWRVVISVLAALLGVQSNKNRTRDFEHGRPSVYIFVGFLVVTISVLLLIGLVNLVMRFAKV